MKIDAHVHYLPPSVKNDLPLWAEREPYWHLLLNPPTGNSIQGYATAVQLLRDMDTAALDQVLLVGEYFHQHDSCVTRNTAVLDLLQRHPDRLLALAAIQPTAGEKALTELQRCLAGGMVGVGELNPYAQNFQLNSSDFQRLAEVCSEAGVPINLHVSEEIGPYYLGKSTTPLRDYYDTAVAFPKLKLILAHWGGGLLFYEQMPRVRRQLAHVHYDTAASPLLYPTDQIFPTALACVPPHKILYGSDYPLRLYPRRQKEPSFQPFLAEINALNLPRATYQAIMGGNAERIFRVQGAGFKVQGAGFKGQGAGFKGQGGGEEPAPSSLIAQHSALSPSSLIAQHSALSPSSLIAQHSALSPSSLIAHRSALLSTLTTIYPETIPLLARYGVTNWAMWEPLGQAAAARGLGHTAVETLLNELTELISRE